MGKKLRIRGGFVRRETDRAILVNLSIEGITRQGSSINTTMDVWFPKSQIESRGLHGTEVYATPFILEKKETDIANNLDLKLCGIRILED
jgi:hypothetical protein